MGKYDRAKGYELSVVNWEKQQNLFLQVLLGVPNLEIRMLLFSM